MSSYTDFELFIALSVLDCVSVSFTIYYITRNIKREHNDIY